MKRITSIFASLLLAASALCAQELTNFAFRGQKPVISPETQNDSVTFRLKADYATIVKLSGSWMPNPWGDTIDMKRGENNVWEVTIPLPDPEIYTYNFVADGVSVNDPQNVMVQRDGSRYLSMLLVDGERTENYKPAEQRGTVSHPWYDSKILGINRRLTVYTPYGYETNPKAKYPVLYLLHGAGGDEEAWCSMGRTAQILDNLIAKGLAEPMIVVMPNALNSNYANWPEVGMGFNMYDFLLDELMPLVYNWFPASDKREDNFIAGLSMGGRGTCVYAFNHPEKFAAAAILSAAPRDMAQLEVLEPKMYHRTLQSVRNYGSLENYLASYENTWRIFQEKAHTGELPRLYFTIGTDDHLYPSYAHFKEVAREIGLDAIFEEVDGYCHEWRFWDLSIQKALEFFGL